MEKLEKGELIIAGNLIERIKKGLGETVRFAYTSTRHIIAKDDKRTYAFKFAIKFSDFNPNNMRETKKHILCVDNDILMKYYDSKRK